MKGLDTNVLACYLTQDEPRQAAIAVDGRDACARGPLAGRWAG